MEVGIGIIECVYAHNCGGQCCLEALLENGECFAICRRKERERQYPFCFVVCVLYMKRGIVVVVQARIQDWGSSLVDFGSILCLDFVDAVVTLFSGFGGEFGVIHGGLCFYSQGHRFRQCRESLKRDNIGRAEKTETCKARAGGKSN